MVKQIKLILLAVYSVMAAFLLSAISSCCPGTAGYDWHSGESEVIQTSSQMQKSAGSSRETNFSNSIGMNFVYIPPGSFLRGSPTEELGRESDEKQQLVSLSHGYYMQTTEVTQEQWKAVMGSLPLYIIKCDEKCPVERVSWDNAQEFINKLNVLEESQKYRLPTEAEWEYAARAGSSTSFANGEISVLTCDNDTKLGDIGWYCGNSKISRHHIVAQKKPNSWGLYDMHGGVWEWCADWYGPYSSEAVTDPGGPLDGAERTMRGGGIADTARSCRSANRHSLRPDVEFNNIGLRIVRSL
jgi:formylglycine-generating enzyme required for sulfatase activity